MAILKAELREILERYEIDPRDKSQLWDCHGTLVLYHRAYEIIAAKERITFDPPTMIESNGADKIVAMLVVGRWKDRVEWSIGEAAPGNSKNAYPYAIAEKRAKDRVVAKLVGLAAHVYSEDEADEFKDQSEVAEPRKEVMPDRTAATTTAAPHNAKPPSSEAGAARSLYKRIAQQIVDAAAPEEVGRVLDVYAGDIEDLPAVGQNGIRELARKRYNELRAT